MRMRRDDWSAYASAFLLASGSLAALTSCSDQATSAENEELGASSDGVIIGTNDLVKVEAGGTNLDARYRPYVNAFGRLAKGSGSSLSGFCTATHLGNGIGVSAGHCWSAGATRQNNISCSSGSTCSGHVVQWGYTSGGTASTSNVTRILAMQQSSGTNRLDYAIFEVSPVPPDYVPVDWSGKAPSGTTLSIFSHPQARPLEWSKTCTLQSPGTTQLSYQCDTEPGSSGATVLNDTALKVTGIHWGGGGSANSATYILSTPIAEFLQPPDGGTGGTGGAGGAAGAAGSGGKAGAAGAAGSGGKGGADGGDAATSDASDASADAPGDVSGDGAGGSAGSAGAAGSSGSGGVGGMGGASGASGAAGKAGSGGAGGLGGSGGSSGAAGKGGTAGTGGATGGASGSGGTTGGAAGATGGAAGTTGGTASGGKAGTGGSSSGTGGSGSSDDGGCSCRIATSEGSSASEHSRLFLMAIAVGLVGRRRRRRQER